MRATLGGCRASFVTRHCGTRPHDIRVQPLPAGKLPDLVTPMSDETREVEKGE
jgi:hypothetical protein